MKEISIIIRSRNEEKWISACLEAIRSQTVTNYEIILVDNESSDRTLEKVRQFNVKTVHYKDEKFHPGRAINEGIRASEGKYVAIISAHCIPVDEYWLENLLRNIGDAGVAGVYGRQEPLPFTSALDKRDLVNVFGLDRKVQQKDPFFHNANSIVRRDVWEKVPFDEDCLHIEDRIWGQAVLEAGYTLVYEPEASVFHYHGINQGRNIDRAKRIVQILEQIHAPNNERIIEGLNIAAIIPSRGSVKMLNNKPLIRRTIDSARASQYINRVIVASDNEDKLAVISEFDCETVLRPKSLSHNYVGLVKVYQYVLDYLKEQEYSPDLVVLLEEIYPFRPPGLIDRMIEGLLHGGYDSVIAANLEYSSVWRMENGNLDRVDSGLLPSVAKEPLYRGLPGLGCVTPPGVIYSGSKVGQNTGLITVDDYFSQISLHSEVEVEVAELLEKKWEETIGASR